MSHTSGGRVSTVIGGIAYSARGVITLDPSNISVTSGVNQDGTVYRNVAPKARTAEITFDSFVTVNDEPLRWDESIMLLTNLGITFVEDDTNITHILSGGFFTGSPQHDTSSGEVSGLGLAADSYKTLNG
ncbi:hypothetical protein XI06_15070 [Bradyrhizobium sp. CCBAU 11434]|uniref:phage tail tube protein n=1 Tax=Bradyrhizobium sp. CCBAU 11434 TaxID=1630885 RepID=UPI0023057FF9|nr:phage tail tube protein [Bradyrhizobium sp. CCBAU 11434]MDA9521629.1 hypothetical protein [Bradyrhizobium sp. CCBAU 11434]